MTMCMTTPGSVLLCLQSKMKIPQDFEVKHLKNIFGFDFERLQASIIEAEANPGGGAKPSKHTHPAIYVRRQTTHGRRRGTILK